MAHQGAVAEEEPLHLNTTILGPLLAEGLTAWSRQSFGLNDQETRSRVILLINDLIIIPRGSRRFGSWSMGVGEEADVLYPRGAWKLLSEVGQ